MNDVFHENIIDINIFNESATPRITLHSHTDIGSNKITITYKNILHAPICIATNNKTTVRMIDNAFCYHNILKTGAGTVIFAAARFHTNTVITGTNGAIINKYIFATAYINTVPILRPIIIKNIYMIHGEIGTAIWIKHKFWRIS